MNWCRMSRKAIFICYRRNDAADAVARVYDKLTSVFGADAVFRDIDTIPIGADFAAHIADVLLNCRFFLAMVGPHWVDTSDCSGAPRLNNPQDWVRVELETALEIGLKIVPVLLANARMPHAGSVPDSLERFARLNAAPVRPDPDFHKDMDKLIAELQRELQPKNNSSPSFEIWQELQTTQRCDELQRFAETFSGTPEAFAARRRIAQLNAFSGIARLDGYLELLEDQLSLGREVKSETLERIVGRALVAIDDFLDDWPTSEWEERLLNSRAMLCRLSQYIVRKLAWGDSDDSDDPASWIHRYEEDRERLQGKASRLPLSLGALRSD